MGLDQGGIRNYKQENYPEDKVGILMSSLFYSRHILKKELKFHAPRIAVKDIMGSMDQIIWQNNSW